VDEKEVVPTLANGLPQPPMPQRLRELLKGYPRHLELLQKDLDDLIEDHAKSIPLFEQAVWALEGRTSAFIREAQAELEQAQAGGDPAAVEKAGGKASLMRRARSANGGLGDLDNLWSYFEEHKDAIQ